MSVFVETNAKLLFLYCIGSWSFRRKKKKI